MSRFPGDPWAVLGLPPGSDKASIKARYRQLALELHPDTCVHPTAETSARFAEITAAAEKLLRRVRPMKCSMEGWMHHKTKCPNVLARAER
jgi:preprotein translocase subunit Sec63